MVRTFVNTMHNLICKRIPQSAVSFALLFTSALWCVGAFEYYATSGLRNNWSATPLLWMLIVMVTPAICFAAALILVDTHKRSRLSRLGWCALGAASFPVTLGTLLAFWSVKVLFTMSGSGV